MKSYILCLGPKLLRLLLLLLSLKGIYTLGDYIKIVKITKKFSVNISLFLYFKRLL